MARRPYRGLVVAGALAFGVTWGIAVLVSAVLLDTSDGNDTGCAGTCHDRAAVLWIPVAGPTIADRRDPSREEAGHRTSLLWSAAQLAGVTMLAVGLYGHEVPVRRVAERPTLQLLPMLARGAGGMALTARW
jgi:hypothetical protein